MEKHPKQLHVRVSARDLERARALADELGMSLSELTRVLLQLPADLVEIMAEVDETNRLAARAAMGDRSALRECIEIDPALAGLDRLYCQELVDKLIELHDDVITRL